MFKPFKIRNLAGRASVLYYGLATAIQAAASFATLPILIRLIGHEQYARYSLIEPLIPVLSQVFLLGAHQWIFKRVCQDSQDTSAIFRRLLLASQPLILAFCIVEWGAILAMTDSLLLAFLSAVWTYLECNCLLALTSVRAANMAMYYLIGIFIRSLGVLLVFYTSYFFGVIRIDSAEMAIMVLVISSMISAVTLGSVLIRRSDKVVVDISLSKSFSELVQGIRYGFPLIIASFSHGVILYADRYVLGVYSTATVLTSYVVMVKYANAMNFAMAPINLWWPSARFAHLKDSDGGQKFFSNWSLILCTYYALAAAILLLFQSALMPLLSNGAPTDYMTLVFLLFGMLIYGVTVPMNVGLFEAHSTRYNLLVAIIAAVVHLVACFILIPIAGLRGGGAAILLSFIVLLFGIHVASQRFRPIRFNYGLLLIPLMALSVIVYAVGRMGA